MVIEVADVDLRHVVVAAEHLSDCVEPSHLEVLVLDALVRPPQVDTTSHLACAFLGHREEGRPKAVRGVRRQNPNGLDIEIMLQSLGACQPLFAARLVPES